jgi:integrase
VTRERGDEIAPLDEDDKLDWRARAASRRAGIAEVTFHPLRYTAASHLAQRAPLPLAIRGCT